MNYNSVAEILASGITNMNVIRNNNKQDDGYDTIAGVSWFSYNGAVASTIYVSGNSFIGFGSNTEHLKVNRRDGAMWYLYREEGTLNGSIRFLKIRWKGYTTYNQTSTAYALEYDVILWDTGDISLHMVTAPTTYANGTYTLGSTTYTINSSNPDVTFTKTGSGYIVNNTIINFAITRYLIRSNSTYYTISNESLSEIGNVELTSDTFLTHGVSKITNFTLLTNLSNPELLYWSNNTFTPEVGLIINGTPSFPQVVNYAVQSIPDDKSSLLKAEVLDSNDSLFSVSFDGGITWKYFDNGTWANAASVSEGMTANTIKNITADKWGEVSTSKSFQFRCSLMSVDSTAGRLAVKYA